MVDLHMHSTFSDGKHSPEEMIEEGIRRGLTRIGISDHSYVEMDDSSMPAEGDEAYRREMKRLKEKYAGADRDPAAAWSGIITPTTGWNTTM